MNVLKRLWYWLDDHKTKLMGAVVTVLGALMAQKDLLEQLLPPTAFAWFVVGSGVIVTLIGSTNTMRQKMKQQEKL